MSSLVVRGLEPSVKEAIKSRAAKNGRSMEAEVRAILTKATQPHNIGQAFYDMARTFEGVELEIAPRSAAARIVEFE